MHRWRLQEAKGRLEQVVLSALETGPQEIIAPGSTAVVIVSKAAYGRLRRRRESLVAFLRRSPLAGLDLEIERR